MNKLTLIGIDLAKNTFHLVLCDQHGKMIGRKQLSRAKLHPFLGNTPACTVAMEACSGSHYWARIAAGHGHSVRLIPAQYVKAYLRGNKNDFNDALAIAEAARCPHMRLVKPKSPEQQANTTLARKRKSLINQRTRHINQMRAMLLEHGYHFAKGVTAIRKGVHQLLLTPAVLPPLIMEILHDDYAELLHLDTRIQSYNAMVKRVVNGSAACQRLMQIPGFGPIVAQAFAAYVGDTKAFARGRDVSASLGMVPRQHSSGGKQVLLGISKKGDALLRTHLIHGARAVVNCLGDKQDPLSCWLRQLVERVGKNKATVAYAAKMCRIGWSVLHYQTEFDPAWCPRPTAVTHTYG